MISKKAPGVILINPETTPIVYTEEGHVLGGGERCTVDRPDEVAQRAVEHGLLISESAAKEPEPEADAEKPRTGASDPKSAS